MRILQFNHFGTCVGGVENYIAEVSAAFAYAGHKAQLISFASERVSELMANTVQIEPKTLGAKLADIERAIIDFKPDVAYIHAVYDPQIIRWITDRLPTITYVHSPYPVCPGYALFLRQSSQICRRTVGLGCLVNAQIEHCCFGRNPIGHIRRLCQVYELLEILSHTQTLVGSEFMRDRLIDNGLQRERINLLAPLIFSSLPSRYIRPSFPKTILFVGRITPEKGLQDLIRALAMLRHNWRLIVAGDGPARTMCEQLVEQFGLEEQVKFLGWVTTDNLKKLYQYCAFVVIPSLWPEPYGRVGPEAFFNGRPVVAYAVGGIPDWLEDGKTGYLVKPGEVENLRKAILQLIVRPDKCESMGRIAHEWACTQGNAENHIQELIANFRSTFND